MISKIISGGQTGADRAALDVAIRLGIPHGGWVPRGRRAEDGIVPSKYRLQETTTPRYADRTERNILSSDATLIVSRGPLTGGSRLTWILAHRHAKACLHVDLECTPLAEAAPAVSEWIFGHNVHTLNVAGPRASHDPRVYGLVIELLELVLMPVRRGFRNR